VTVVVGLSNVKDMNCWNPCPDTQMSTQEEEQAPSVISEHMDQQSLDTEVSA
jgi:hypothetical protein